MSARSSNAAKYASGNPVVQYLLGRFLDAVAQEVQRARPERVADLGCGEGLVAARLRRALPHLSYVGVELSAAAVQEARARVPEAEIVQGDLLTVVPRRGWADVTLCLEVLEHLEDPLAALDVLCQWTRGSVVVSVPWEPYFRLGNLARGKYLARLGNHPEHVGAFGPRSLGALLERRLRDVRVRRCFPWLIAVGQPRSS